MLNLVIYEAKVALLLAVFYICYRVLLSRETLHRLNRIVLTGSVLVSFILPFCVLTFHRTVEVAAGAAMPAAAIRTENPPSRAPQANSFASAGQRWADKTRTSKGTPYSLRTPTAFSTVGRSDLDPMTIPIFFMFFSS
jgi:hypothetical protein